MNRGTIPSISASTTLASRTSMGLESVMTATLRFIIFYHYLEEGRSTEASRDERREKRHARKEMGNGISKR